MGNRLPARVIAAVVVPIMLFISLASWALASPVGASPDEDYHLASIWCGGGIKAGICEAGDSAQTRQVPAILLDSSRCFAFKADQSASCAQMPSSVMANTTRGNFFDRGYPPVFYAVMSIFVSSNVSASIMLMRAFNAFLFVAVVSALFFLLPRSRRGPLVWGAAITIVPLGMFLIPSVNPSSWAIISAGTLWVALVGFFREKNVKRRVAFAGIAALTTLVGAGARSDSAVYSVLAVLVALVLTFRRTRGHLAMLLLPIVLTVFSIFIFFTSGQSSVVNADGFDKATDINVWELFQTNVVQLPQLWAGALGTFGLGWLDTAMPGIVWVPTFAIFGGFAFWGLQKLGARKAIVVALVALSLVVVPMYILIHDRVLVGAGVQPRYIYPLMILFAGLLLLQLKRDDLGMSRTQLIIAGSLATLANSNALHVNIRRYVTGIDVVDVNLSTSVEWWWNLPISPNWVWVIGTLSFAGAVFGLIACVTTKRDTLSGSHSLSASRFAVRD
ncbi:DUF2142 domain-containing protein [Cryobacterium sp. MDB1-18-2]|uniref:DUF2142 domain-containing protein n=1 Tax=unclassified Cryobacterium TaxID=2649013 RepID=UPI0010690FAB|nr:MULTISPECIES: DUF2142 domain-containing protein [unclassified Cryobacterium]TFC11894.1 DUF2142 domain-containing protein [Cryobacterium sp. MDB2-33-2]TFC24211.1 DUF2142 domain-containing protein [Cryobacterium sp. MDB1-18-2]TFC43133.1 DUF2142 domain-containing protein [Cryobacterium sp. MDB1-18-1]